MEMAGVTADPWQAGLITTPARRTLLLCSRSAGKSSASAALATVTAIREKSLVLLVSPTDRQSGELMLKVRQFFTAAHSPIAKIKDTDHELRLANGSRIIALPGKEGTIRTYNGVALLIIDEAARVPDELYKTVRPMLAVSGGSLLALSTPWGRQGWFHDAWIAAEKGEEPWQLVRVTAHDCPRISPEFLAEERKALGDLWFRQEYECDFVSVEGAEWPPEYFEEDRIYFREWPPDLICRALALDPSKGQNAKVNDYAAFVLMAVDSSGRLWVEADMHRGRGTEFLASTAVDLCRAWKPDIFGVEVNFGQNLFCTMIEAEARRQALPVPLVNIDNAVPKNVRIRRLGPYLSQGKIRFADTPGTRKLVQQLQEFPEGAHDDGPDSAEMALRLLLGLMGQDEGSGDVVYR